MEKYPLKMSLMESMGSNKEEANHLAKPSLCLILRSIVQIELHSFLRPLNKIIFKDKETIC